MTNEKTFEERFTEVAGFWKNEKGQITSSETKVAIPEGAKLVLFPNQFATEENKQPQFRGYLPKE